MARVLNTSNLRSTYFGGGRIYSVVYNEQLENGFIGVVGKLKDGETEIREFSKIENIENPAELVLISLPEVMYDERPSMRKLENFVIPAGTAARGYGLSVGDEFEVSIDAISNLDATITNDIGKVVTLKNNSFEFEKKDSVTNEKFACEILGFSNMNRPLQVTKDKLPVTKMARLKIKKYENQ